MDDERDAAEFVEQMEPKVLPPEKPYETCNNCRFVGYVGSGQVCRRRAPLGSLDDWEGCKFATPVFPSVPCPPWCGEWEQG